MYTKRPSQGQTRHVTAYAIRDWLAGCLRMQYSAIGDFKMFNVVHLGSIASGLSGFISKFIIICEK